MVNGGVTVTVVDQGSAASPYQTGIDLSEPAFQCTCPSHKFPCKHGLGLFLLLAGLWHLVRQYRLTCLRNFFSR